MASSPPRLTLEPEKIEIGRVKAGESAAFRTTMRNGGGLPLQILHVEPDCGCVNPRFPATVPAGTEAMLEGVFEPQATWSGRVEKKLKIRTNDPARPEVIVRLAAEVIPFVRALPPQPALVQYVPGKKYEHRVRLKPRDGIRLTGVSATAPWIKASLRPAKEAGETELLIQAGPLDGPGDHSATVKIATSEGRLPELWYSVSALALTGPVVSPDRLRPPLLMNPQPGTELGRFRVLNRSAPLKVLSVSSSSPYLSVEALPPSGGAVEILVRAAAGKQWPRGPFEAAISVETDDAGYPRLTVPFVTNVR